MHFCFCITSNPTCHPPLNGCLAKNRCLTAVTRQFLSNKFPPAHPFILIPAPTCKHRHTHSHVTRAHQMLTIKSNQSVSDCLLSCARMCVLDCVCACVGQRVWRLKSEETMSAVSVISFLCSKGTLALCLCLTVCYFLRFLTS